MSDKTSIEWASATWNPVVGCSIVSPGCTNCYAMRQAARVETMFDATHGKAGGGTPFLPSPYAGVTRDTKAGAVWTGKVAIVDDHALTKPLHWKRPRAIFVNSMGDLFHESVPDAWIDRVFAVMALAPQHTFIVLTKRAKRMREYLMNPWSRVNIGDRVGNISADGDNDHDAFVNGPWPLPNVILGVSAERQQEADERIPDLLATPAAKRIVSAEPLLGRIDFSSFFYVGAEGGIDFAYSHSKLIDGVIVGGESGPGARPMHPDWARAIRDQCAAASVPYFFKQWGEWAPRAACPSAWDGHDGLAFDVTHVSSPEGDGRNDVFRVGKRRAGRLLDGREHDDLPWSVAP